MSYWIRAVNYFKTWWDFNASEMQDERLTKSLVGHYRSSEYVPKESEGNNQLVYILRVLTSTLVCYTAVLWRHATLLPTSVAWRQEERLCSHPVLTRNCVAKACFQPLCYDQVTTVDRYQGQQNDYIILSLVRTKTVGHIRDVRRLVVAMSRARLGLYVLARVSLFQNCFELRPAFSQVKNTKQNDEPSR